jgi:radical SAM/Cys-rich protein
MHATLPLLQTTDFPPLRRARLQTLQVNLGYRCNQQCLHCHVNAGPRRRESMDRATVEQVLAFARSAGVTTLDLTGGAPELNPHFRYLVCAARALGIEVIDRCNLTVLEEPGHEDLAEFLAEQRVQITASLPCYLEENVERQRGKGVFHASLRGLRRLNALGYGTADSARVLNLVYNPQGPVLPPSQADLEAAYRRELGERHGVRFTRLLTLANMPIQRFGSTLISRGEFQSYMRLLRAAHQDANLAGVMCRTLLSVDWRGYVYDCDFNQMLGLPLGGRRRHLSELMHRNLEGMPIAVADHCYGCTAGQGSSCGGALDTLDKGNGGDK